MGSTSARRCRESLVGSGAVLITAGAAAVFYFYGRRGRRDLIAAGILLVISLIAFVVAASRKGDFIVPPAPGGTLGLIYLAPVCIFGFLLCPYLDLTFLRARASTDAYTGIAAFTIGFGVLFLALIAFTFWYARLMTPGNVEHVPRALAWIIGGHMMLQSAFTVALHTRALSEDRRAKNRELVISFFVALIIAFLIGAWGRQILPVYFGKGETVYRLFMAFYGLIFPAYVWLFVVPGRNTADISDRHRWIVLAVAVFIASPMFWLGFIESRMGWLVPGIVVLLLSRVVFLFIGPSHRVDSPRSKAHAR
jgi:hypothetical protein